MKKAYHQAVRAYEKKEVPVGAIMVQKNKIIGQILEESNADPK